MMGAKAKIDFQRINAALDPHVVIPQWLPRGRMVGSEWVALNPNRSDKTPGSFSVNLVTGQWADFAGGDRDKGGDLISLYAYLFCGGDQGKAAHELAGNGDATGDAGAANDEPAARTRIVASYRYESGDGELLYEVCRYEPKGFRQRRPDSTQRGGWNWSVKGVTQVPYRLPQMLADSSAPVFIVEGEKDADSLAALGLIATCNAGGANKWPDDLIPHFRGRHVRILPDNDQAGRDHAALVSHKLAGIAADVRIVTLPNLPEKGDVSDWLASGHDAAELLALAKEAPRMDSVPTQANRFAFLNVGEIVEHLKPIDWLVRGYVERDSMAVIYGEPGHGKSFVAIDVACCVATGSDWHGRAFKRGAVFYIAGEGHNGLARRFSAWSKARGVSLAGAPLFVSNRSAALTEGMSAKTVAGTVRELAAATGETPSLIVVDTLARNFGAGDENSAADMGAFVTNLDNELRHPWKATVAIVHHSGKDTSRGARGSTALRGAVDAEYEIARDENGTIRMQPHKMKDAEAPDPLAFKLNSVPLPLLDDDGNRVFGAALQAMDYIDPPKAGKAGRGKHQRAALEALAELEREYRARLADTDFDPGQALVKVEAWENRLIRDGMPRQRLWDTRKSLHEQGLIEFLPGGYVKTL